jgi:hypothetical protein
MRDKTLHGFDVTALTRNSSTLTPFNHIQLFQIPMLEITVAPNRSLKLFPYPWNLQLTFLKAHGIVI